MLNQDVVRTISHNRKEPEWLLAKRMEAFKQFENLPMPTGRYGLGIFSNSTVNIDKINPLDKKEELVVVNDASVNVMRFSEALQKKELLMKQFFSQTYNDKFDAMHAAFFNDGLFIHIPQGVIVSTPVQINLDLISQASIENIFVLAEPNSEVTIIEHTKSTTAKGFRSQYLNINVQENASVEYVSVQNLGDTINNFCQRKATLEKNARVSWLSCCAGSEFTKTTTTTLLNGEGANSNNCSMFFGDNNQNFDIHDQMIHQASHTTSDMLTKGVLKGKAKTVYRGLVKIMPGAKNCQGYQKEDTILLSEHAEADAVPNLEIHNNDVKCSHGATIGQVDREKIHYLMSRGLSEPTAIRTLVEGFFEPLIKKISNESLSNSMKELIAQRMEVPC